MSPVRVRFLGTGASGGTPGTGRSARLESSACVEDDARILIDVTRHFTEQAAAFTAPLDAILLTHAHRDASGGLGAPLRRWWAAADQRGLPVLAHPGTLDAIRTRYRRLDHLRLESVRPGDTRYVGQWAVDACEVPHASDPRFPTYAWRLRRSGAGLVYASDVARLTDDLCRFSAGADLLVIDGAMYRRSLPSHLRVDRDLPSLCDWDVGQIVLTQIGRSAPPHERFAEIVEDLCPRAAPAFDGLVLALTPGDQAG